MILVVAPYSPPNREGYAHLGASRKLETIISILSKLDESIMLINTAHNDTTPATIKVDTVNIGGVDLIEVTPPIYSKRTIGKLKNLFDIEPVINVIKKHGSPQFIWFYNGYAFEMLLAAKAQKVFEVPMILEFEDWHFSRGRGLNPKPYIDYILWRLAVRFMAGAFVVNEQLANKLRGIVNHVELLPGIVPKVLADIAKESPPFSDSSGSINIGFFGGLSVEKGADIVLKLATTLPAGYVLHVTGTGALAADFEACAKEHPERLHFYGRVNDSKLYNIISQCDVMLNPHSSIVNMNNGVFPFKVIEAVASGRMLISTAVPTNGLEDVLLGVEFVEHDVESFCAAIVNSRKHFLSKKLLIAQCAALANQRFGEDALINKARSMIDIKSRAN